MRSQPILLIQARIRPSILVEFRRWYATVHVPHVLAIPGIVGYRALSFGVGAARSTPNLLSVFAFLDDSVIQAALASSEAQRVRQDWQQWASEVRNLSIQVYTGIDATVSLRHLN